jgi:TolB-like protein/Tfp pilus assembly protein PilF
LSFFNELKRRNVFRVAIAYIVVSWLVMQVADVILNNISAPGWVFQVILLLLGIGFALSIFFAWAFEMTPEGIKREHEVDRSKSITPHTGKKLNNLILAVMALALGYFSYDKFVLSSGRDAALVEATTQAVAEQAPAEPEVTAELEQSIAVLPFVNMSADASNEYFSDGLSEELPNLLAKIPELRVTSRSSAFSYKGKDFKIADIGRELNVRNILEGSVRKAGNQVRITAQLIKVDGDVHLWSETYDRSLDNIFAIQDEIATAVVAQLKLKLFGDLPAAQETNPEAFAFFLQARHFSNLLTPAGWEQSNELFKQALAVDPDYAAAWAGLSRNYINLTGYNILPVEEGTAKATEASNQALAIDPLNVMALSNLSWIARTRDSDLALAAQYMERALELEPTNIYLIRNAATLVQSLGRLDDAILLLEFVVARDPVNPVGHLNLGQMYVIAGRLDEAMLSSRTALSLSPGGGGAYYWLGEALLRKGEPEAALEAFLQEDDDEWRVKGTALALHDLGRIPEFEAAFAELSERWGGRWPIEIAHVYAWIGNTDEAFVWMDKEIGVNGLAGVMTDNFFTHLHDDPRWQPLLTKAGVSADQLNAIKFEVTLPR